jgi:hypothetical protein
MPATLGTLSLPAGMTLDPADDLWCPITQATAVTLSGALVVEEFTQVAGRPLTLIGGRSGNLIFCRATRATVLALKTALDDSTPRTLTLEDGQAFRVVPRRTDGPALVAEPLPGVADRAPSDPGDDWHYVIDRIRFLEIPA